MPKGHDAHALHGPGHHFKVGLLQRPPRADMRIAPQRDDIFHANVKVRPGVLRQISTLASHRQAIKLSHIVSPDMDSSSSRRKDPGHQSNESRLSRSVGSDQSGHRTAPERYINILKNDPEGEPRRTQHW